MLIVLALGFAAALSLRHQSALAPWHWLAPWRQWWLPMLPVLAALLLWLAQPVAVPSAGSFARYLPWAALQQYLLLVIVARRLDFALRWRAWAMLLAALLFALAHTPNTPLMLLTFAAGLLWVGWFLRCGALLPVILAHALGATLLLGIASDSGWLRSLAVGGRYLGWGGSEPVKESPRLLRLLLDASGCVAGTPKIAYVGPATRAIFCTQRLAGAAQDQPRDGSRFIHRF